MKRRGILNVHLASILASLGHRDEVAIVDCGMPIPAGTIVVDLALIRGVPRFNDVLDAIADELVVEGYVYATESEQHNPDLLTRLDECFPDVDAEVVGHGVLKERLGRVRAVVRSGEATPYSNVILVCGVAF
ncbi:MAG: D-ribose pyranase [Trueperaceae bacterium]|nr:D-ribose pyranase [Trueperaceae bacterium]